MKNKLFSLFTSAITVLFGGIITLILILVLYLRHITTYIHKEAFNLPNYILALIGVVTIILLSVMYIWQKKRIDYFFSLLPKFTPIILSILLFATQILVFHNIFFVTGWDVYKILTTAELVAYPGDFINDWYYNLYPNNLFITFLFSIVFKITNLFGFTDLYSHVFVLILIQSFLCCLAGYLLFKATQTLIKNPIIPYLTWILFTLHIGLSPWICIPYSDALTLVLPIAIFRLFQLTENKQHLIIKWIMIGVLSYIGFKIKPQVLIIFIAILIYEASVFLFKSENREKLLRSTAYLACIIAICITTVFSNYVNATIPIEHNEERAFGLTHFFMMGFNPETGGVYSPEDVYFSDSFASPEERSKANIEKALERIHNFGFVGFTKYMAKKAMLNFDNGTYAWSVEGSFYYDIPENPNTTLSPLLRSFYYYDGENYHHFSTLQQYLWIIILLGNFGIIFILQDEKMRSAVAVAVLALIGLTMFEMLFEARARYLFNYAPIFIMNASVGWYAILKTFVHKLCKLKSKLMKKEVHE